MRTNNLADGRGGATRRWRTIVAVALGFAVLVALASFALRYARWERREAIEGWRTRLTAIADDRAAAIAQWVAHGRGDARMLADHPAIIERLTAPAGRDRAPVGGGPAAQQVQAVLDTFVRTQGYRSAYLVTEAGTLLAANAGSLPLDDACLSAARRIFAGGEGTPEFHLHADGSPLVLFAAQVPREAVPQRDAAHPPIRGVAVLESDPHTWLYPILAREPTYTATGETVLFGREGTDLVFLNPPRQAGARPIGQRVRVGSSTLAALKTPGGFCARVDSRGIPVFAATSPVAGAPWSVVVKVEESEALAPYRRELRTNAMAASAFLLFLAGASFALWRERRFAYEKAIARGQARLSLVLEHANDAILFLSLDGRVLDANRAALSAYGYSRDELCALIMRDLCADGMSAESWDRMKAGAARDGFVGEAIHRRKDGTAFPVEVSSRVARLDDEEVFLAIVRDIGERKRAERQIRMLAHSLKSIGECVRITGRDDRILFVNEAFLKTYGYTEEELIGQPIPILRSPRAANPREEEILGATLAGGWRGELINRRKNGSEFPVFLSTSVVRDDAGSPIVLVGVATDLTERKRLEEQFAHAQRMETVGALAGGIAHDFNNLMQAVLSHTQLVLAHSYEPDQVRTWARKIQERIAHGASITRQLLIFSRREVAKVELLDLNEVVRSTSGFLHHLIRENVTVQLDLASSPLPIEADRGQLEQAVMNLAANASEAMPNGGRLTFETGVAENGDAQLVVRDTGRGIPEEVRDRIFEPFFSTKHASEGAGLGLAVVHGIVSEHGGRIEVESDLGKGTTFRITLPRKVSGESAAVPETVVEPQASGEGHGERVLLVEDEEAVREGLTEMLSVLGYEVVAVESGEEAQALPAQPPFHLLLTDLLLPGVSGTELARALAARWRDLKVIVMSGYAEDGAVRQGGTAGAFRFLQKPFDMDTLDREVRAALAER